MKYTDVPREISFSEILSTTTHSISSAQYKRVIIPNANCLTVRDFLSHKLTNADLGSEVGSVNYIDKSPKYFFRTKGLQRYSLLPEANSESITPLNPKAFVERHLQKD